MQATLHMIVVETRIVCLWWLSTNWIWQESSDRSWWYGLCWRRALCTFLPVCFAFFHVFPSWLADWIKVKSCLKAWADVSSISHTNLSNLWNFPQSWASVQHIPRVVPTYDHRCWHPCIWQFWKDSPAQRCSWWAFECGASTRLVALNWIQKDWRQDHVPQVRLLVGHGPDSLSSDMAAERLTLFDDSLTYGNATYEKLQDFLPSFPALYPATSKSVTKGWDETGCMINAKQHFAVPSQLGFTWWSPNVFGHSLMSHFACRFWLTVLTVHDAKAGTSKMQNHYIGQPSKVMLL